MGADGLRTSREENQKKKSTATEDKKGKHDKMG